MTQFPGPYNMLRLWWLCFRIARRQGWPMATSARAALREAVLLRIAWKGSWT